MAQELCFNPDRKHDFVFLFDVVNGNPNGDPDAGNMPRIDPETNHGFVTDVALKRKIRDYAALVHGKAIFVQSKVALNTLYYNSMAEHGYAFPEVEVNDEGLLEWLVNEAADVFDVNEDLKKVRYIREMKNQKDILDTVKEEVGEVPPEIRPKLEQLVKDLVAAGRNLKKLSASDRDAIKEVMTKRYYDMRMFGAVLTAGTNAGQVRGPVQLTFARSISPILPMDVSITRVAITREADKRSKQTEMGRKPIVPYGLYRCHGFYNPKLAERLTSKGNPVTSEDLAVLWEALGNMFEYDRSAARGEMTCRGLYIFSHDDEKGLGKAPAHKLFDLIRIEQKEPSKPPRSFDDYEIVVNQKELPPGIELKAYV
ncbi:MAG TPA: type I-C CRISPR-associated protein Cas7/Csd2 [Syntrophothermus lipocalidus]|uniref:CRISPR-associated protein, Csd2 family n=1 Tax=Syntrophothermus lipocalidus (strain DSM 12680 / TGB-C1) TaxID=643648 RepID=D7CNM3_SYNLT|nr:type I-C CRISPR-associated protein Cas7/Csd2 [Syntrophothermus lipocalidus]ADI02308.1 CRISPR-associated protein, Csd2 family [Syntrophothermus lipocalidus DSM 12680]HHV76836.1 type I-C CRISPR-associated protein Cas7/Csd2 [Syntrophothermus lipocalidus]